MKKILLIIIFVVYILQIGLSQTRNVELKIASFKTDDNVFMDSFTAAKAVQLANKVLNSKEFKDEVKRHKFRCQNYGEDCYTDPFPGNVVLDSIYKNKVLSLNLYVRFCNYEYGRSEEDDNYIWSCYEVLKKNTDGLLIEYIYAAHICHEYMHIVGFYHTYTEDDVAEKIGNIAWELLKKWK